MTYSRRTWANGNAWDATAANDWEGRVETEFVLKSNAVAASASLPGSPVDGQELYYLADTTNGVVWHLRYRSGSASAYKWEFVGGGSMEDEYLPAEATTMSTSAWGGISANDPQSTVPLAGDYDVHLAVHVGLSVGGAIAIGVKVGATEPVVNTNSSNAAVAAGNNAGLIQNRRLAGVAATTVLQMRFWQNAGNVTVTSYHKSMLVRPIRVG